jgi:hypothetical protein
MAVDRTLRIQSQRADKADIEVSRPSLYPGDSIEYGITHEVRLPDGTSMWMKMSSTTKVQPDEPGAGAASRLVDFIHTQTEQRVIEAVNSAQRI